MRPFPRPRRAGSSSASNGITRPSTGVGSTWLNPNSPFWRRNVCIAAFADKQILAHEVTAWHDHRNKHHAKADWKFTTANARVKLKRLYPQFD
jgi:hypothetical protein